MLLNLRFIDLVGLTIEEALPKAADRGIRSIRPYQIDGRPMPVTADYRPDRLNVALVSDRILEIEGVG